MESILSSQLGNNGAKQTVQCACLCLTLLFSAHVLLNVETQKKCEVEHFIIYLQWNTSDTTTFPTGKYKILYHATRVIFFRITILHVLPNSQDKSQHLAANS